MARRTLLQRLMAQSKVLPNGCLIWTGYLNKDGYGQISHHNKNCRVHREAWIMRHGPIPNGLQVLHSCDNPACFLDDHLFLGTCADNMQDKLMKGRNAGPIVRGEQHGFAKLLDVQVARIRKLVSMGFMASSVAKQFGVSTSHVCSIAKNKTRLIYTKNPLY